MSAADLHKEKMIMFQFTVTGNVRNTNFPMEQYVDPTTGEINQKTTVNLNLKTTEPFPIFIDIEVRGALAWRCAKYLRRGRVATFIVRVETAAGYPYNYRFIGEDVGFFTDYNAPIPY